MNDSTSEALLLYPGTGGYDGKARICTRDCPAACDGKRCGSDACTRSWIDNGLDEFCGGHGPDGRSVMAYAHQSRGVMHCCAIAAVAAMLVAPQAAHAQPIEKIARVGVLASSSELNFGPSVDAFRRALRNAGWVEGKNLTLDIRYADEQYARLPDLAAELVGLKVDVLTSMGTPATLAAKRATTTIPIVMESLSDVMSIGLVANLTRPGGNITGASGFAPELSGKRLQLIREICPRAERIGVLANQANPITPPILRAMESSGQRLGLKLLVHDVRKSAELEAAFSTMKREHADAMVLVADPFLFTERALIVELAAQSRLPALYEFRLFPDSGGLLSYGPFPQERFERMAWYVDRILRGARPGDMPIEQPTKFELVINLKTAKALGLTIPQSLLLRADAVIQ